VLILGPVTDKKQNTMAREALDKNSEHCLAFGVYPVEVLDHQDEGLATALLE
jgi:hypothetical protein